MSRKKKKKVSSVIGTSIPRHLEPIKNWLRLDTATTIDELVLSLSEKKSIDIIIETTPRLNGENDYTFSIRWIGENASLCSSSSPSILHTERAANIEALEWIMKNWEKINSSGKLEPEKVEASKDSEEMVYIKIPENYEFIGTNSDTGELILKRIPDFNYITEKFTPGGQFEERGEEIRKKTFEYQRLLEVASFLNLEDLLAEDEKWYFFLTDQNVVDIRMCTITPNIPTAPLPYVTFKTKKGIEKALEILGEESIRIVINPYL